MDPFGFLFIVPGALFFGVGGWFLVRAWQSGHWPKAIGTVVSSAITEYYDRGTLMYRPAITFRYSVSGNEYESDRRMYGGEMGLNMREPAQELIAKFPPGTNVTVHHNPRNPAEAVLQPGQYLPAAVFLGLGAVLMVVGWLSL